MAEMDIEGGCADNRSPTRREVATALPTAGMAPFLDADQPFSQDQARRLMALCNEPKTDSGKYVLEAHVPCDDLSEFIAANDSSAIERALAARLINLQAARSRGIVEGAISVDFSRKEAVLPVNREELETAAEMSFDTYQKSRSTVRNPLPPAR